MIKSLFIPKNLFIRLFLIVLTKHNDGFIDLSCALALFLPMFVSNAKFNCLRFI